VYNAEEYWNVRFKNEGEVWGKEQSLSAKLAAEVFKRYSVKNDTGPRLRIRKKLPLFRKAGVFSNGYRCFDNCYRNS